METSNLRLEAVLRSRPVHTIELGSTIAVRRGRVEFHISGPGASSALSRILKCGEGSGLLKEEILQKFDVDEQATAGTLIEHLIERDVLYYAQPDAVNDGGNETTLDLFYWHFGRSIGDINRTLSLREIVLIGANDLSFALMSVFKDSGIDNLRIVDDPMLRGPSSFLDKTKNLNLIDGADFMEEIKSNRKPVCVVTTSTAPNRRALLDWNNWAVDTESHFYPVMMDDLSAFSGPLVVPGQTACYECLQARWNSNLSSQSYALPNGRTDSASLAHGYHPAMVAMLAGVAALEVTKLYNGLAESRAADLIELDYVGRTMRPHRVLKVPRCGVCSNTLSWSQSAITTDQMIPQFRYSQLFAEQ